MSENIMLQGTMSGVGKSLITAALCRIFAQDGYSVAPFKSQNMALNSFVTRDGLEIGRAQAVQAYAAGKEPDVRMNPVLLKPSSETGSQLIVGGTVKGDYNAEAYFKKKKELVPDIMRAYHSLKEENDIIVIEGAGSPAEINLKSDDIVNMGMAERADAPVLLIADIDPGGVFAQIYGTVKLLPDNEAKRIKGIIINKFRGDRALLENGLKQIEDLTKIPVIGVIPYIKIDIDDEDSMSERLNVKSHDKLIDVAVIRLPFISNHTDFIPFERSELTGVRYVCNIRELKRPDMIIIPGTKDTVGDLKWLKSSGLDKAIIALSMQGTPVLGICGGYQMLGRRIYDEESDESVEGIGLLPVKTIFGKGNGKIRKQSRGVINNVFFREVRVSGYEIHMGITLKDTEDCDNENESSGYFIKKDDDTEDGFISGNVYGTYFHGLFDNAEVLRIFEDMLLALRGIDIKDTGRYEISDRKISSQILYREEQIDILAKTVRDNIDMDLLYKIIEME
ncbi:MAG: cobyric acid synthase [Lachnospiraceae bacterium]|nr:cobyric acid synthase [Lachnospiraceae bacterium]